MALNNYRKWNLNRVLCLTTIYIVWHVRFYIKCVIFPVRSRLHDRSFLWPIYTSSLTKASVCKKVARPCLGRMPLQGCGSQTGRQWLRQKVVLYVKLLRHPPVKGPVFPIISPSDSASHWSVAYYNGIVGNTRLGDSALILHMITYA